MCVCVCLCNKASLNDYSLRTFKGEIASFQRISFLKTKTLKAAFC